MHCHSNHLFDVQWFHFRHFVVHLFVPLHYVWCSSSITIILVFNLFAPSHCGCCSMIPFVIILLLWILLIPLCCVSYLMVPLSSNKCLIFWFHYVLFVVCFLHLNLLCFVAFLIHCVFTGWAQQRPIVFVS